jgi:hypothetical protein
MAQLCQPDDNLVPGQTYTFQLKSENIIEIVFATTVSQDITNNAPNFISNLQVTSPFSTSLYDVQFNYTGDGTDVVSDVANSLISAVQQGSGDSFSFVGAVADTAQTIIVSPVNAAGKVTSTVTDAVNTATKSLSDTLNTAVTSATNTASQGVQNLLTPVELAVGILAIVVIAIIFTSGKAGGVSASETGLNIGGK